MVIPLVSCFFSMARVWKACRLSAINLYGQFMPLMLFCILYGHTMIFMFFLKIF